MLIIDGQAVMSGHFIYVGYWSIIRFRDRVSRNNERAQSLLVRLLWDGVIMKFITKIFTILGMAFLFSIFMLLSGTHGADKPDVIGYPRVAQGDWTIVFAAQSDSSNENDGVYAYKNGKVQRLLNNQPGFRSLPLDNWIGYIDQLGGVVFYPFNEDHFRIMRIDLNVHKVSAQDIGLRCSRTCNALGYSAYSGKLWVIKGKGHQAKLYSYGIGGESKLVSMWTIPRSVRVPYKKWMSAPAIQGSNVAFASPSESVLLATIGNSSIKILKLGNPRWNDPGYDVYSAADVAVAISAKGDKVAYALPYREQKRTEFYVYNLKTSKTTAYSILDTRGEDSKIEPLSPPIKMSWIPNSNLLACELMPGVSGMDVIALLDIKTRESTLLPMRVGRFQWCIVTRKTDSLQRTFTPTSDAHQASK